MVKFTCYLSLFLGIPFFVLAEQPEKSVVINEIAWMGTPVEGVESKQWWRYEWFTLNDLS